ncbi:Acyl transferase/acyl hydrolase/lysophospholipase [Penicillium mononematosum]|uniref:Acyl transferase/acyl hydrolase/lysophospholipase n=1 Tax=Penicillium mononematosum TaxID=268346 RepID=UPI002549C08B|nr:Acyl transferase/acyl hydrolase/lysophospholipase [Penicillium mononematosum]KAJ6191687.1 Acyl transferase/acyl hydrolase/lysophospholipase [Penicillium mononematosum]
MTPESTHIGDSPNQVLSLTTDSVDNLPEPALLSYPLFTHLWRLGGSGGRKSNNPNSAKLSIKGALDEAPEKRLQIVIEGVIEKLEVDSGMAPSHYRVNSLVANEVRDWLSKEVGMEVGVLDIVGSQSMVDLGERVLKARG